MGFCIEHPVWCRVVGVVWEFAVVLTTIILIPWGCLTVVGYLLALTPPAVVLSLPFLLLACVSMLVGLAWSFRRHFA